MSIPSPAQANAHFGRIFNAADRQAILAYYAADVKLILPPDQQVVGRQAVGQALEGFLALQGTMTFEPLLAIENGDTALVRSKWKLTGTGTDGKPVIMEGSNLEVLRKKADGTWECVIDAPFGGN